MVQLEHAEPIQGGFDDHRRVANAGLLLPDTLAFQSGTRRQNPDHRLILRIYQTYSLFEEGARRHNTRRRGYHPLLAEAATTS